jgi:hypothetical protein
MSTFRKTDREFSEKIFRNAEQQEVNSNEPLGNELEGEFLLDNNTGEVIPIKIKYTVLTINEQGMPVVRTNIGNQVLSCGHRACSLEQVLGRCKLGHTVCTRCQLYTCSICGEKLCDKEVLWWDDERPYCPDHEKDIIKTRIQSGALRIIGDTVKYLCGWDGDE